MGTGQGPVICIDFTCIISALFFVHCIVFFIPDASQCIIALGISSGTSNLYGNIVDSLLPTCIYREILTIQNRKLANLGEPK